MTSVKPMLSGLEGIKKTYISLKEGWVLYDSNLLTAEEIAETVNTRTSFGAKVIQTSPEDLSKFPKSCGFLGLFCD